jgi:hypothetical protein
MRSLETDEWIRDTKVSRTEDNLAYHLKFDWMRSIGDDAAYQIDKEVVERAPGVISFNINEVAKHCNEESFHVDISISGFMRIKWRVPSYWKSLPIRTQRVIERFVSIVFDRAFEMSQRLEDDLFRCPYYYVHGFSFDGWKRALLEGVMSTCKACNKFADTFKLLGEWQAILLYRAQVLAIINQVEDLDGIFGVDAPTRNQALATLHEAERKLNSSLLDCVVNNVVLWELGDSL